MHDGDLNLIQALTHFQVGYIHSRGGARGWPGGAVATNLSLATPLATPLKTAVFVPFFLDKKYIY